MARRCVWSRNLENEEAKARYLGCENTTTMGCNAKEKKNYQLQIWWVPHQKQKRYFNSEYLISSNSFQSTGGWSMQMPRIALQIIHSLYEISASYSYH